MQSKDKKNGRLVRTFSTIETAKKGHLLPPSLDTLEITSETPPQIAGIDDFDLSGNGSANHENLVKRNASKYLNNWLVLALVDTESELKEKYWDTYHCSDQIVVEADRAKSNFCKKRWCLICNRIRTAELIQKYMPTVESWPDKQFVTLTIPNPKGHELEYYLAMMLKAFTKTKDKLRKQGKKLVGLRKLEITYNRRADTFHPHFHLITKHDYSKEIIDSWLSHFTSASIKAQDSKAADKNSCFELFKYFTKITSNSSKDEFITAAALDKIFRTITGKRTFQTFGFIPHAPIDPRVKEEAEEFAEEELFSWQKDFHTWINKETGEFLTRWIPNRRLVEKVKKIQ